MPMPFIDKEFTFTQPDGEAFRVRGTGNQHHAVFHTPDGYLVVRDPVSGVYQLADCDEDGLHPLDARPGSVRPETLGLAKHLKPPPQIVRDSRFTTGLPRSPSRWETRRQAHRRAVASVAPGLLHAPPARQIVGSYVGVCLLIRFPDVDCAITQAEVDAFCNQAGYAGYGNNGSVHDYFHEVSDGKLTYTNLVAPWFTARHERSYYTDETIPQPGRARELILEALEHLKASGFDLSTLSVDDQGYAFALNVFYAGLTVNNWSQGLWPHSEHLEVPYELQPGMFAFDYQMSDLGTELSLGTFCHENGHLICDFPDLYDYGMESSGVGAFCLMCAGGAGAQAEKNPAHVGAYLKMAAGWASSVSLTTPAREVSIAAGRNDFLVHRRSPQEYFIIENRQQAGRDALLPAAGLAVWKVDELGDNSNEQMTPASHYECSLIQADGLNQLEKGAGDGDAGDFFSGPAGFSDATTPNSRWWDGSASGLSISVISPAGPTMTLKVE